MKFTRKNVKEIVETVGGFPPDGDIDSLTKELQETSDTFFALKKVGSETPATGKLTEQFQNIETTATRLLKLLGEADVGVSSEKATPIRQRIEAAASPYKNAPKDEREKALNNAIDGVRKILSWTQWAKGRETVIKDIKKVIHSPSDLDWLKGKELPEIYEKHFQKKYTYPRKLKTHEEALDDKLIEKISQEDFDRLVDQGTFEPQSPGITFVSSCLEIMGLDTGPYGIAQSRIRYKNKYEKNDKNKK